MPEREFSSEDDAKKFVKDAIKKARESALEYRVSMFVHKISKETHKILDYMGVAEFPYYLRNCKLEFRDIHFIKSI